MIALRYKPCPTIQSLIVPGVAAFAVLLGLVAAAAPARAAEKTADLAKFCKARHGNQAFPNVDRRDNGILCTVRTNRGRGLRHYKISAADICTDLYKTARFRRAGKRLICITTGGKKTAKRTAKTIDLKKFCKSNYGPKAFVTRRRTDNRPMCTVRTSGGLGLRYHVIDLAGLCGGGSPRASGNTLRCGQATVGGGSGGGGKALGARGGDGSGSKRASGRGGRGGAPVGGGRGTFSRDFDIRKCPTLNNNEKYTRRRGPNGRTFAQGDVESPCPGLTGGIRIDLVEECKRLWGQKRDPDRILLFTRNGTPFCGFRNWSPGNKLDASTEFMFLGTCDRAHPGALKSKLVIVFRYRYHSRYVECFYVTREQVAALKGRKPASTTKKSPKKRRPITITVKEW